MDYKNLAKDFDETHTVNKRIINELTTHFPINKQIRVLDFGCGSGNYIYKLSQFTCYNLYGVDACDEMLAIARDKNPTCKILKGNHSNIPFPDSYFDYIYMTNVIHHINELDVLFKELHRVLKKGGIICICTENLRQLLGKYWIRFFPSIIIIDPFRFHRISKISSYASKNSFFRLRITTTTEKGKTRITPFILRQVQKRSMSVLQLVPDYEYMLGKRKMVRSYNKQRIFMSYRGYTFIWLRKR